MDFQTTKQVFETLYSTVDGHKVSSNARAKLSYYDKGLTYGEVVPESFSQILATVIPKKGEVFYDLGSGTGKAIFLASLLFDFRKIGGIELLEDLHKASKTVLERYNGEILPGLSEEKQKQFIHLIHGSFLEQDISDADVLFTYSTCFLDEIMIQLEKRLSVLKKGARVITVTKTLYSPLFQLTKSGEYQFSWGKAMVNFYEKIL